jgi:ABC-type sulfate transport system permease subunit
MDVLSVSQGSSTELVVTALAAAASVLVSMIIRIVLCALAASATRKALQDFDSEQVDADALRAHRLAVLRAILAALSPHSHSKTI